MISMTKVWNSAYNIYKLKGVLDSYNYLEISQIIFIKFNIKKFNKLQNYFKSGFVRTGLLIYGKMFQKS